jgi:hypothetical protein
MASYGTKRGLANAMLSNDRSSLKRRLRELVQEDGPLHSERLLVRIATHNPEIAPEDLQMALGLLNIEQKANLRTLKRMFPDTWHLR